MFIMESPVFEKHFNGNFLEGKSMPEVRIEEFHPKDFKNFYFMIYNSDDISRQGLLKKLNTSEITELYRICHKYMVSSILKVCYQHIKTSHKTKRYPLKDIILLFGMANELNDVELLTLIEKAILSHNSHFDEILNDLPPDYFYKYMVIVNKKQCYIPAQLDKFNALERYILENNLIEKGKDSFLNPNTLLELVDLKKISPRDFISGPGNSKIFDWKTKYEILAELITIYNRNGNRDYYY
ncbi:hypothetical protein DOY81_014535 [Sarcophaga bullata]|nr:hypothetical protein DOY81_014535 [Sarcophaga bullata]